MIWLLILRNVFYLLFLIKLKILIGNVNDGIKFIVFNIGRNYYILYFLRMIIVMFIRCLMLIGIEG